MRTLNQRTTGMTLVLAALTTSWGCGPVELQSEELESFAEEAQEVAALGVGKPIDAPGLRAGEFVRDGDVGGVIPPPGYWVSLEARRLDGIDDALEIDNRSGSVVIRRRAKRRSDTPAPVVGTSAFALSGPACSDGAYSFMFGGGHWTTRYDWMFRAITTPDANNVGNVEESLRLAVHDIVGGRNNCGLTDAIGASASYLGRTELGSSVVSDTNSYHCGTLNQRNVVGFGALPKGVLGVACVWGSSDGGIVKGDVKLNKAFYRWFAGRDVPAGCTNAFSVEGIATHEFGHVFGLGHVSEADHGNLTMSTAAPACSVAQATLGLGDVRGLRALY